MNLSYQEKSIWVILISTVLVFGSYFYAAFKLFPFTSFPNSPLIALFIGTIVGYIILQIILHIGLALFHVKEAEGDTDERDALIELKATRISYFVLIFGVWVAGCSMFLFISTVTMANIIMFFFVLAEIIGNVVQLYYYRRGF